MTRSLLLPLLAVLLLAPLLSGCSGAGAPATDVAGSEVQTLAADTLNTIMLLGTWSGLLYRQKPVGPPPTSVERLPDGTRRVTTAESDGAICVAELHPDSSGSWTITWPDGSWWHNSHDATTWSSDRKTATSHSVETGSNGGRLEWTGTVHFRAPTTRLWEGTATSPQGRQMQFRWDHVEFERDILTLQLFDGAVLSWQLPVTQVPDWEIYPRFADGSAGTYQTQGKTLAFHLSGQDSWSECSITGPNGETGSFTLGEGMSGQGQLTRNGSQEALLRWTLDFLGILDLIGTGQAQVSPSAAAQQFQLSHWVRNAVILGPAPAY